MKLTWTIATFAILIVIVGCSSESPATEEQVQQPVEQPIEQPTDVPSQTENSEQPPGSETSETPAVEPSQEGVLVGETEVQPEDVQVSPAPTGNERCYDPDVTSEFPDGINFNVATEILVNGKKIINGKDYCPNVATISEWYCQDGIARVKTTPCQVGSCKEGVCA